MMRSANREPLPSGWTMTAEIVQEEGWMALFAGSVGANVIKTMTAAITVLLFDAAMSVLKR